MTQLPLALFNIQNIYNRAGSEYKNKAGSTQLEALEKEMADSELGEEVGKKLKEAVSQFRPLLEYAKVNDIFVEKLVEMAEEKGADYALSEEAINAARKWAFPSLEDYRKHKEAGMKLATNALDSVYTMLEVLGAGGDEGEKAMMSLVRTAMEKSIGSYVKLAAEIGDEIAEQAIKKTYGEAKPSAGSSLEQERAKIVEKYIAANK